MCRNRIIEYKCIQTIIVGKIAIFRVIQENKCEDGETSSSGTKIKSLTEIQTLYDETGQETSLVECMIRSTKVRWLTCKEDVKYWELWDEKEEFIN